MLRPSLEIALACVSVHPVRSSRKPFTSSASSNRVPLAGSQINASWPEVDLPKPTATEPSPETPKATRAEKGDESVAYVYDRRHIFPEQFDVEESGKVLPMLRNSTHPVTILLAALIVSVVSIVTPHAVRADSIMHGLGYSPYMDGQGPPDLVDPNQIRDRLAIVASYPRWIRNWGMRSGLEHVPGIAKEFGLSVAACAFINGDPNNDARQKDNLLAAADDIDIAIVGSEAMVNGLDPNELILHLDDVRQRLNDAGYGPADTKFIPVTTAEPFGNWPNSQPGGLFHRENSVLVNGRVLEHIDLLFVNIYPFHEGVHIDGAIENLANLLQDTRSAVDEVVIGLPIIIGETGWPTDGNSNNLAEPTLANAYRYFHDLLDWAADDPENRKLFYFEAFDENWKDPGYANVENHWGLHYADGTEKFAIPVPSLSFWGRVVLGVGLLSFAALWKRESQADPPPTSGLEC